MSDDYLNLKNLYYGKGTALDEENIILVILKIIIKKLDKLEEIDTLKWRGEFDKLDEVLFDSTALSN